MNGSVAEAFALLQEGDSKAWNAPMKSRPIGESKLGHVLRLGVGQDGGHHLLIPLTRGMVREDRKSRHVQLVERSLVLPGGRQARFADLFCEVSSLHGVFDELVEDVLKLVRESDEDPVEICLVTLEKWRALFIVRTGPLSLDGEQGLLCELLVLLDLVRMEPGIALNGWDGPAGASRDFNNGTHAIEVKSTRTLDGTTVRVSNMEQLDPTGLESLGLVVVHLRSARMGITVQSVAAQILGKGVDRRGFLGRLERTGYLYGETPLHQFEVIKKRFWRVDEDFPSLRRHHIPRNIQTSISNVTYDVSLPPGGFDDDEEAYSEALEAWITG